MLPLAWSGLRPRQNEDQKPLIVIDAGHGGDDRGLRCKWHCTYSGSGYVCHAPDVDGIRHSEHVIHRDPSAFDARLATSDRGIDADSLLPVHELELLAGDPAGCRGLVRNEIVVIVGLRPAKGVVVGRDEDQARRDVDADADGGRIERRRPIAPEGAGRGAR